MRYSKSLDLVIAALTFGHRGNMAKAAICFDKALSMKDLQPTLAMLEKRQVAAHAMLTSSVVKQKTTAELLSELAAKRKSQTAKLPFPGAAPPFKKKTESESDTDEDDMDEDDEEDAGFKDYSPDKQAKYLLNHPKSKWHSGGKKKKKAKASAESDEGESFDDIADQMTVAEADSDEDEDEEDLEMDDDGAEDEEASLDDVDTGFLDTMENLDPSMPSVDGEGQPGEGFSEMSESDDEDEDIEEDAGFENYSKDKQAKYLLNHPGSKRHTRPKVKVKTKPAPAKPPVKKKAKANSASETVASRVKRVQANLQALARLSTHNRK